MRIIAGTARRTKLVAPMGLATRPTSDMAKENLFNIIGTQIRSAAFLDLFCGSGAIGLEALSRGASEAILVDNCKNAIAAAQQNITKTKLSATLLQLPAQVALDKLQAAGHHFDIIFLDPPYDSNLLEETLSTIASSTLLAPGGTVIAETDINIQIPTRLQLTDKRKYGRISFLFMEAA